MVSPEEAFLGAGWSFPPHFERQSCSVVMVHGEVDIHESLWILLSTAKGERVMVPDYGCDLWRLVFKGIDNSLIGQAEYAVSQAILNWEPRITVDALNATAKPGTVGVLLINVDYTIRKTNARSNLVYPFYLEEGTVRPLEA